MHTRSSSRRGSVFLWEAWKDDGTAEGEFVGCELLGVSVVDGDSMRERERDGQRRGEERSKITINAARLVIYLPNLHTQFTPPPPAPLTSDPPERPAQIHGNKQPQQQQMRGEQQRQQQHRRQAQAKDRQPPPQHHLSSGPTFKREQVPQAQSQHSR